MSEIVGRTLNRSPDILKSQRHTFGQRLMNQHTYVLLANRSPNSGTTSNECGVMPGGTTLLGRSHEATLTLARVLIGEPGRDTARVVAGNHPQAGETHGSQLATQTEFDFSLPRPPKPMCGASPQDEL